ncbi:MAG: hypothetical protein SCM96_11345 [Acidobacteriota bacterium]|nr:hypothetical protein [Acidobacteriota bacterium]
MIRKVSLVSIVLLAVLSLSAWAADVSGTWAMTSQGRQGEMTRDITIAQDGNKITVTMPPGPRGGDPMVGEGTIDGDAIQWTINRETPRGQMTMVYKGTVDGDTMKGTVTVMDNEMEWTAKKK